MNKKNLISIALTVLIASVLIIGGTYAIKRIQTTDTKTPESDNNKESIDESRLNTVKNHIRDNISELSPKEEKLGGSFYVTNIEFLDDSSAMVEYEDGHNAYTAKAEFSLTPDEEVTINSFELAEENNDNAKVENHIRDNISELSPKEEKLGGNFYVTNIEFLDDSSAMVEYEDGHNAYTAKAEFSLTPDEKVIINSFGLLEGSKDELSEEVNFSETGNLTRKGENWQLVYEKSGQPALTAKLKFTEQSRCINTPETEESISCSQISWEQGARATVNGIKDNSAVEVILIVFKK